jgi:type IV secretory pathway VirB6-like protein
MALTFKKAGGIQEIMSSMDALENKVSKTAKSLSAKLSVANTGMKDLAKNLMVAGGGMLALFWGVAQVSPVLKQYMGAFMDVLGALITELLMPFLPLLDFLLDKLISFMEWFEAAPPWVKGLATALIVLVAGIIAMKIALWALSTVPIVAVIILIVGALVVLYLIILKVREWLMKLYEENKTFAKIVDFCAGVVKAFVFWLRVLWEVMKLATGAIVSGLKAIGNFVKNVAGLFKNLIKDAFNWGKDLIMKFIEGILSMVKKVADTVKGVIDTVAKSIGFDILSNDMMAKRWGADLGKYFSSGLASTFPEIQTATPVPFGGGAAPFTRTAGLPGGGGSTTTQTIKIEINNPILTSRSDIDYLVAQVSKKLEHQKARRV